MTIWLFMSRMSQLNGYIVTHPCLYDSEYAISTTCCLNKPFTESELAQIVLDAVPATWRSQYNINHTTVPTDLHLLLTDLEKVERYVEAIKAQEQRSQKKNEKGKVGTPSNKNRLKLVPSAMPVVRSNPSQERRLKQPKCVSCARSMGAHLQLTILKSAVAMTKMGTN